MRILQETIRREWLTQLCFTQAGMAELDSVAAKIQESAPLCDYFARYYETEIVTGNWIHLWDMEQPNPLVEQAFGRQHTLFYLLCYLERLAYTQAEYSRLGISQEIYVETLSDIGVWLENWNDRYGFYCFRNLGWIWRHLDVKLFRIGRLQYQLATYQGDAIALRHKQTGEVVCFSTDDMEINAFGDRTGSGGVENDVTAFTAKGAVLDAHGVTGHPITPYGKVQSAIASLSLQEYDVIAQKGCAVLELHIPRSGKFTPEDCAASYRQALDFYATIFNVRDIAALVCHTWLFTPQLQEMLTRDSNIVKFQREFYLLPWCGNSGFMWNFVFNETTTRETAVGDTHLRRQLLTYLDEKRPVFDLRGWLLHMPEKWGTQPYMTAFDHTVVEEKAYGQT